MFEKYQGKRAFDNCNVKVIKFKTMVYEHGDAGKMVLDDNSSENARTHAGNGATLRCPRTEEDGINIESQYANHPDKLAALESVRELAGPLLCRTCSYSGMTRAQVANERAEFARAEADRLEAARARDMAIKQLAEQTDGPYMGLLEQHKSES